MGRKLNISQPAVIQTELRPLDESFWIDANGRFEQWYYQNTNVFAPDRQITPLILTPYLSAVDRDTNITYTPSFQLDSWEVKEYIDGAWVTTTITSQSQTADYVLQGLSLIVKKNNYDATHAINITCKATYQDPRDVGVLRSVQDSVMLVTSIDATQAFPKIDIVNPATRTYNPLKDESPIYEFEGKADWEGVEAQGGTAITECKVDPLGTEQILPTNDEMVLNAAPTLNIHYGDIEKANQKFMYRQTANGEVSEIVGGVSAIDNIKGNTVAWNQIMPISNIDKSITQNGVTITDNRNGTYTVQTTAQGCQGTVIFSLPNTQSIIKGHKYLLNGTPSTGSASTYYFGDFMYGGRDYGSGSIVTMTYNTGTPSYKISINDGTIITTPVIFCPIVVDLTLMFGAGNEPSTVAEFETWLANNVGLKDYYEYCAGKLINFGGYGVKWNQMFLHTGNYIYDGGGVLINEISKGVYTVNGTALTIVTRYMFTVNLVNGHKYYMKGCPSGGTLSTYKLVGNVFDEFGDGMIYTATQDYQNTNFGIKISNGYTANNLVFTPKLIDLTEMFGAGNEPDLEWCNKYFSKDYYPYCPSVDRNILDVMTTKEVVDGVAQYKSPEMGIKTVGFNQWDEEWEKGDIDVNTGQKKNGNYVVSKNYIPILQLPYFISSSSVARLFFYDSNYNYIKYIIDPTTIPSATIPQNAKYIKFRTKEAYGTTYNHDICLNISDPERNGTYEPYWESKSDMSWITKIGIENFNIWDEEWEVGDINSSGQNIDSTTQIRSKNFCPIKGGGSACFKIPTDDSRLYLYDKNYNIVDYYWSTAPVRIIPIANKIAYFKIAMGSSYGTTYNHDICINVSNAHFNGRYYPHGETAPYFPNGLCNAGSAFDEVKVENGKIKGVVRLGSVDLRTVPWSYDSGAHYIDDFQNYAIGLKAPERNTSAGNVLSQYYICVGDNDWRTGGFFITVGRQAGRTADVNDPPVGILIYELETPYEFEIDYPTKGQFMWYGVNGSGSEVPIDQLPIYSQATQPSGYGQGTSRININALYGENIPVILRVKRYPWSPTVLPPKVTKSVAWSVPPIDVITTCDKGSAVRATNSSENFIFGTIVNQQGEIISEEKKAENMVFDWYMVKYGTSGAVKTSQGSGLTKSIPASTLKNTTPSGGVTPCTNVYCEAFLLGAYHLVNGQYVRTKD